MKMKPSILAFAGSTRENSFNKTLVKLAVNRARKAGAEVTILDLRDLPLPLYDGDLEQQAGMPPNGERLKDLLKSHQGFLIASPEYNSSISAVLKNAIDWASRRAGDEAPLVCFRGKVAVLMSASPGALGGLRGLVHLRAILQNMGTLVIPDQVAIPDAPDAFDRSGNLKDEKQQQSIEALADKLVDMLTKLHAG